ncbi:hypothetical protein BDZ89DRAFT_359373 [Hymenopellis radicata]|nr:hypothetical protein BDZ89DRAFT_359373 [Hymenopellis radicata]
MGHTQGTLVVGLNLIHKTSLTAISAVASSKSSDPKPCPSEEHTLASDTKPPLSATLESAWRTTSRKVAEVHVGCRGRVRLGIWNRCPSFPCFKGTIPKWFHALRHSKRVRRRQEGNAGSQVVCSDSSLFVAVQLRSGSDMCIQFGRNYRTSRLYVCARQEVD